MVVLHKFHWAPLEQACMREGALTAGDLLETVAPLPRKESKPENSQRRRELEREVTCLCNTAKQQSGESLGQRAPKGSSALGSFIATRCVLFMASRCQVPFCGVCKAIGSKWLKNLSNGALFKAISKNLTSVEFELIVLACCKEVNNIGAKIHEPSLTHLYIIVIIIIIIKYLIGKKKRSVHVEVSLSEE